MLHALTPPAIVAPAVPAPPAALPLPYRAPAQRLVHAREDHAKCLRIAAALRVRMSRGERGLREQHDWSIGHARTLRLRFPGLLFPSAL